jgi:hypothetical protein
VSEFWNLRTPSSLVIVSSYIPVQKVWKNLHERGLLMLIFSYGFPKAFKSFLAVLFCSKKVLTCLHQKLCNFQSESLLLSQSSKVPWTKLTEFFYSLLGLPRKTNPPITIKTHINFWYWLGVVLGEGFSSTLFVGFWVFFEWALLEAFFPNWISGKKDETWHNNFLSRQLEMWKLLWLSKIMMQYGFSYAKKPWLTTQVWDKLSNPFQCKMFCVKLYITLVWH